MVRSETKEIGLDLVDLILEAPAIALGESPTRHQTTIETEDNVHVGIGSTPEESQRMASDSYAEARQEANYNSRAEENSSPSYDEEEDDDDDDDYYDDDNCSGEEEYEEDCSRDNGPGLGTFLVGAGLVGALAIAGVAIYEHFKEKIKKARDDSLALEGRPYRDIEIHWPDGYVDDFRLYPATDTEEEYMGPIPDAYPSKKSTLSKSEIRRLEKLGEEIMEEGSFRDKI